MMKWAKWMGALMIGLILTASQAWAQNSPPINLATTFLTDSRSPYYFCSIACFLERLKIKKP